jgi:Type IV secretion-system coupling protein DNA-binding domain
VKSADLRWFRLRWPRDVAPDLLAQVWRMLATAGGQPIIVEAVGSAGRVEHRLALSSGRAASVVDQLQAALPGLAIELQRERPALLAGRAVELRLSTARRPLATDEPVGASRAVITALAHAAHGEQLTIQWVLGRATAPSVVPNQLEGLGRESWLGAVLLAPFAPPPAPDAELRGALRAKHGEPGWQVIARIGVHATSPSRERQLMSQLAGALAGTEAPGVRWRLRSTPASRVVQAQAGWRWPLRLNATEMAVVTAWPIGPTGELPVATVSSRLLPPVRAIRSAGRVIGRASFPGRERSVALTPKDSLRHLHVLGPTGVGKSTLLANLIAQDMSAGRAVVVVEPKGDLIADVLARVPRERVDDVVVIDPTDTGRPVGLNPLAPAGRSPELVADQLLGLFHTLYAPFWGPRTQDILGASLLTLARAPGMTLTALPLLLTDAGFRRRIVSQVHDPIGLGSFWSTFEAWREPERLAAIAPVMNKLRPLLVRPDLRAIIGQAKPRFELRQVFTERKILLVNLAAGQVGPETSALLGSLVISQLWQATLGRSAIPAERRHPVSIVLDEFQVYLHLPVDIADALAQARGLGVGFALAHQFLHQLDPAMRSAVLANAQSRVAFRLPSEDARLVAPGGSLAAEDFQGLGAFEAYAQLVSDGAVQPWCSVRTLPPGEAISDPVAVRAASRETYGVDRRAIDRDLELLLTGSGRAGPDDLTPRRRGEGHANV